MLCPARLGALLGNPQGGCAPVAVRILHGRDRKTENLPDGLSHGGVCLLCVCGGWAVDQVDSEILPALKSES